MAHWQRIATLVKDAAEWLSIYAGQPNAFGSKPWLQMQLSGDTRAARAWPIEDVDRDIRFVRTILLAAGPVGMGSATLAPGQIDRPASASELGSASEENRKSELATARQAIVMPILQSKKMTRCNWATKAGVGKNSVYDYLAGKRRLSYANRRALAEVLDLQPEGLPD
jgi:hypothetical protein